MRSLAGHYFRILGLAVSPERRRAISASNDTTLKVWDVDTGQELLTLTGHSAQVNGVAVSPDEGWAISASSDITLKVWDLEAV